MVEPKLLENPKVEAETPVEIELEVKTKPEVGLEAEDEAEAKTKAEAEAEADELTCFDKSLQVSIKIIKYLHQFSTLYLLLCNSLLLR